MIIRSCTMQLLKYVNSFLWINFWCWLMLCNFLQKSCLLFLLCFIRSYLSLHSTMSTLLCFKYHKLVESFFFIFNNCTLISIFIDVFFYVFVGSDVYGGYFCYFYAGYFCCFYGIYFSLKKNFLISYVDFPF